MIKSDSANRSQVHLVAFIDLLFLMIAFFVLLLLFIQGEKQVTQKKLEQAEEQLVELEEEKEAFQIEAGKFAPYLDRLKALQTQDTQRRRRIAAREVRRKSRTRITLKYEILPNGRIRYKGKVHKLEDFMKKVVTPGRKNNWLYFRVSAHPDTPFGQVVSYRQKILENKNEFDTYWDNLKK